MILDPEAIALPDPQTLLLDKKVAEACPLDGLNGEKGIKESSRENNHLYPKGSSGGEGEYLNGRQPLRKTFSGGSESKQLNLPR